MPRVRAGRYTPAMRAIPQIAAASLCVLELSAAARQAAQSPPPGTDIYLVQLTGGLSSMKTAKPSPVSTAAGYDNQPMFSADGRHILFAANRDGKQIDVYVYERAA